MADSKSTAVDGLRDVGRRSRQRNARCDLGQAAARGLDEGRRRGPVWLLACEVQPGNASRLGAQRETYSLAMSSAALVTLLLTILRSFSASSLSADLAISFLTGEEAAADFL